MVLGIKADLQDKMLLITVRDREVPRGGDEKSDTSTHSGVLQEPLPVGTGLGGDNSPSSAPQPVLKCVLRKPSAPPAPAGV